MGYYLADPENAVRVFPKKPRVSWQNRLTKTYPPSKKRVWKNFSTSPSRAGFFALQVVEPHREKQPTSTKTASGVLYYGYRYYSPGMGRWISKDPLLDPGSVGTMKIRRGMLAILDSYVLKQISLAQDETHSDEDRLDAFHQAIAAANAFGIISNNEPNLWLLLAGENHFSFCANAPLDNIDPHGQFSPMIVYGVAAAALVVGGVLTYRWILKQREKWKETGIISEEAIEPMLEIGVGLPERLADPAGIPIVSGTFDQMRRLEENQRQRDSELQRLRDDCD